MEEIDLKELISIFMKKKILIIIVVLLFAIVGAIYTVRFIVPLYQSSTSLVLVQVGGDSQAETNSITTTDITLNSKLVDDYREIARSKAVANKVIENLNLQQSVSEIQKSISVTAIAETELIQITVTNKEAELAYRIATEVANVFMEKVNEIYNVSNVHILDAAEIPQEPSNIHLFKNVVIFSFVGAILVSAYILLINMLDTTVKSDLDIEKSLDIPVLASIVLTDDGAKKKMKDSNSSSPDNYDNGTNSNIKISYEHNSIVKNVVSNEKSSDNISLYSYMNGDSTTNKSEENSDKNNNRKGGKK